MQSDSENHTFRFLEKLKAGFGAALSMALVTELALSSGVLVRVLGLSAYAAERVGGLSIALLSLIAFVVVSVLADGSDDHVARKRRG